MARVQVDLLLELVDAVGDRIRRLDERVKRVVQADPEAARLQTWPGIGPFGAALLRAEIGTIERFRSAHELAAYAGLTPSTQSSGDKTRHGSVGRAGSPWLKWLLIEIVQSLKLAPGPVGAQYQRLLRSKGKAKAPVAAARKLCCYLYWCLKERWSYTEWLHQHERREVRPVHLLGSAA
jgi:transposase